MIAQLVIFAASRKPALGAHTHTLGTMQCPINMQVAIACLCPGGKFEVCILWRHAYSVLFAARKQCGRELCWQFLLADFDTCFTCFSYHFICQSHGLAVYICFDMMFNS